MRWLRSIRYVAPWLLGVFVLAQVSCLSPGHYRHAGAAGGHTMMHAPSLGPERARHHVLVDQDDACCAVHAMPLLPAASDAATPRSTGTHRFISPQQHLVSLRSTPLDPPPKLLSSV